MADSSTPSTDDARSGGRLRSLIARGSWLRQGSWTVLDQALFAGANFLVNVLLARWLSPEAYGAFAVAFVLFLLVGAVHGGLFIEPMLVFGAGKFEGRTPAYLRVLLRAHVVFSVVTGVLLAGVGVAMWAWGESGLMVAEFLALGVASGFILALWLLRRACYVIDRPDWAVGAGTLYVVLLLGGAFALLELEWLSGATALALMAVGSVAAALVLAVRLKLFGAQAQVGPDLPDRVYVAHREYGRWAAPTGALEWFHGALPLLVLPLFVGLEGSGTLRALYNLAQPALQGFSALSVMALPLFVRARTEGTLRSVATRWGGGILGLGGTYALLTLVAGRWVVDWLYQGKYAVTTFELICLALLPVAAAMSGILMTWLRSGERTKDVFGARAWAVGVASTVGVGLTAAFSVAGALLADVLAIAVESIAQARAVRQSAPERPAPPRHPDRMRVLLSAYAFYPNSGSEPAVGWHSATELATHHDVWVLTYEGWRSRIEAALAAEPVPGMHVVYVGLPFEHSRHKERGEARHGLSEQLHYLFWQWAAAREARRLHRTLRFDLARHVTLVKYWQPTAIDHLDIPLVWGPVGGGEAAPAAFLQAMSPEGQRFERMRTAAQTFFVRFPSIRRIARRAALSVATTEATAAPMRVLGARSVEVDSAIALDRSEVEELAAIPLPDSSPVRFVAIGRQEEWKGYRYAIDAFATAIASGDPALADAQLWLVGDGPEHDRLTEQAARLGLADRVRLFGRVPRAQVLEILAASHALVQTSLHDSGGGVCLEALAAGRPVIGFDLGGTPVQVGEAGLLVAAETPEQAVEDLAHVMRRLASDADLRLSLGEAGRQRVAREFVWDDKVAALAVRYRSLAGRAAPIEAEPPPPVLV